jgi:hypothetical protein
VANLGEILNDPDFGKFQPADKQKIVDSYLKSAPDFGKLSSDDQLSARSEIYKTAGIPSEPIGGVKQITTPKEALEGALSAMAPKTTTDAVLMGVTSAIPMLGGIAPALEEASPLVSKGLGYLAKHGIGPALARMGVTTAAGAASGGVPGAVQGAGEGVAGEALEAGGSAVSGLRKIEHQMMGAAGPAAAEKAAQGAVERRLGTTSAEAAKLAAPPVGPSPEASGLALAKAGIRTARTEARREVGKLYEPLYEPVDKLPVAADHLGKIASTARGAASTISARGGDFTKPTRDMLEELGTLGSAADTDAIKGQVNDLIRGSKNADPAAVNRFNKFLKAVPPDHVMSREEVEGLAGKALGVDSAPITIGQLRGRLQALEKAGMRPGISEQERSALATASVPIRSTLESVIPDEQKPLLKSINDAYAAVSNAFPYQDLKPLRQASTLPELGKAFSQLRPDATRMVLDRMNPEQKAMMQKSFASFMLNDSTSNKDIFNTLAKHSDSGILKQLGFPDDLQKVGTWRDLVTKVRKIYDKPPDLMQTKEFISGVRKGLREQGVSPELMDQMNEAATKDKSGRMVRMLQSGAMWGTMLGMAGTTGGMRRAAIAVPLLVSYEARKALINNPAYRQFVMNGWTRAGGAAFSRLAGAGIVDAAKEYAAESGMLRPDKEREAEARP